MSDTRKVLPHSPRTSHPNVQDRASLKSHGPSIITCSQSPRQINWIENEIIDHPKFYIMWQIPGRPLMSPNYVIILCFILCLHGTVATQRWPPASVRPVAATEPSRLVQPNRPGGEGHRCRVIRHRHAHHTHRRTDCSDRTSSAEAKMPTGRSSYSVACGHRRDTIRHTTMAPIALAVHPSWTTEATRLDRHGGRGCRSSRRTTRADCSDRTIRRGRSRRQAGLARLLHRRGGAVKSTA